jgi:nitrite reductase/ring-hydroxylating ferredoxin subunit
MPGRVPRRLCALSDLASPGSARFDLELGPGNHGLCVVRKGGQVHGYLNRCPHTGAPLDWQPGQFLTAEGDLIQCSLHGALFRIEDGHCVWGPCAGDALTRMPLTLRGDDIYLEET